MVGQRLEPLEPLGDRLLAALAVIDDGFTADSLIALAGAIRRGRRSPTAETAGVLECARGRYRFRHALVREQLAARLPEETLRRTHAAPRSSSPTRARPRAVAHHLLRAGRAAEAVPLLAEAAEWAAGVGAYRDGAEWAELALEHADARSDPALLALRARLLSGPAMPRRRRLRQGGRGRACRAHPRAAGRSRHARASRRVTSRAPAARSRGAGRAARGPR